MFIELLHGTNRHSGPLGLRRLNKRERAVQRLWVRMTQRGTQALKHAHDFPGEKSQTSRTDGRTEAEVQG